MDPSLITLLCTGIETVVNTALRYDPASRNKIADLNDIVAVEVTNNDASKTLATVYFHGCESGLRVLHHFEDTVGTTLTGSPLALLSLVKQPGNLSHTGVSVNGSIHSLQAWQGVLQELDIDWEDAISSVMGDIAGPLFSQQLRKGAQWFTQQAQENQRLFKEYLPEELRLVPSKTEFELFSREVSELRFDSDRLLAKAELVLARLHNTTKE